MATLEDSPEDVLILAPVGRDAELAAEALTRQGYKPRICKNLTDLVKRLSTPCGAALIAEEALLSPDVSRMTEALRTQPPWSDLPVIILTSGRSATDTSRRLLDLFAPQGNITLLERPIRIITLCSMVEVALRARRRQYQVRDLLEQREQVLSSERAARGEAEKANRMKDEFLANLSHELRTPLNAIIGWSSILRAGSDDPSEVTQGLEAIERNARSQSRIINDLLDMSRIISGKINLECRTFDLRELLESAVKTVKPAAVAREISIETTIARETFPIFADSGRLQQVFYNLLSNAIKFTPIGGTVRLSIVKTGSSVEVLIADSGIGLKPESLSVIFDRFRQADASSTRQHGGLGLGLAIVKQLVELHGGTVRAWSPGPGQGSTFIVSLPTGSQALKARSHPTPSTAGLPVAAARDWRTAKRLKGIRVLVVDDEPDARSMMQRLLQESDAVVETAGSASEAFDRFRSHPPDVLVSDIGMPDENGYQLMRRIRALPRECGGLVPSVALTAYARAEDRVQAINAGFHMHAVKPIEPFELLDIVGSLVDQKTADASGN